jgi:two-component system response regulator AtoC
VRELRNVIERAVVLSCGGEIRPEHLLLHAGTVRDAPSANQSPPRDSSLAEEVDALERARIVQALEKTGGNQTRAAKLLGIARRTLINRMEAYGLQRPRKR